MATTVDHISNGRLEVSLSAGWHEGECNAYGIPFPDPRVRQGQFVEALEVLRGCGPRNTRVMRGNTTLSCVDILFSHF